MISKPKSYRQFSVACVVALVLLAACASPPQVRVDKDAHADFASYKTFAWFGQQGASGAQNSPHPPSTLVSQRVLSSIVAALQSKGYTLSDTNPDFRVSYELNIYERPKQSSMQFGFGVGGGSGNVAGGVGASVPVGKHTEVASAMTIDIVDGKRNAQVWTGSYETVVATPDVSDIEVDRQVASILAKFP